jgi:membrane protease YdiL (CAAX protease family)
MSNELTHNDGLTPTQPATASEAASTPPVTAPEPPKPIAPVWNTVIVVGLILANSVAGPSKVAHLRGNAILVYAGTAILELILFVIVWLGIRKRMSIRELIGGRWNKPEDFLLDFALSIGFLIVAGLLLAGLRIALGTLDLTHINKQVEDTKRMLAPLIPHSKLEAGMFVLLSVCAGFFEEVIFRGYLQRQIGGLTGNIWIGIVVSALIFGAAHGYQGWRMMIVIAFFGSFFGLLAYFRKSLRPGIMAHAMQDAYSGIALYFLAR